jgi:hypothetical protein
VEKLKKTMQKYTQKNVKKKIEGEKKVEGG